jgi:putative membrane protein
VRPAFSINPKPIENGNKLKESAAAYRMERSTARVEDSADRRAELAADRTVFAAERTYAAWVRSGPCRDGKRAPRRS